MQAKRAGNTAVGGCGWLGVCAAVAMWPVAGCSVDTYAIGVGSAELSAATLESVSEQGDEVDGGTRLAFSWSLSANEAGECPQLGDAVEAVLESAAGPVPLRITERGGGAKEVRCVLKCDELVGIRTRCEPVRAELVGDAARAIQAASSVRLVLSDAESRRTAEFAGEQLAARSMRLETARAMQSGGVAGPTWSVPFSWSHADKVWLAGELGESYGSGLFAYGMGLSAEEEAAFGAEAHVLRVFVGRGNKQSGVVRVQAEGKPPAACDFASCAPVTHAVQLEVATADW